MQDNHTQPSRAHSRSAILDLWHRVKKEVRARVGEKRASWVEAAHRVAEIDERGRLVLEAEYADAEKAARDFGLYEEVERIIQDRGWAEGLDVRVRPEEKRDGPRRALRTDADLLVSTWWRGELTHARHDRAHCLAPGLFRSLRKGDRKTEKLDVTYDYGGGQRIQFVGPEPLGADDLRVLVGLVAMAGPRGLVLEPDTRHQAGEQLRLALDPKWDAMQDDALAVKGSIRELALAVGYRGGGRSYRIIRESVRRLYTVTVFAETNGKERGYRLLSSYGSDMSGGLFVALNPMIARAVAGGQHTRIDMREVRAIRSNSTRLIHQRLCGWIDPGGSGKVRLDTLCEYAWPDPPASIRVRYWRRSTARRALRELEGMGWTVSEYDRAKVEIARPDLSS